jgi:hypothetical protein
MKKRKINFSKIKARIKFEIKSFIAILPYHILVMSGVAIFSFIFDKWLEALCFLVSFFALRYKFPTTFHAKKILHCMLITNATFATSIVFCPSIYMYIFGGLLFAYLDCLLLWYIQSREELKQDKECAEWFVRELTYQLKDNQNPLEKLLSQCKQAKLSKRDTEIAIKYYYEHQTPKEIWLWLCENKEYESIEWDSVYRLLYRIGNKLNIKN